MKDPILMWYFFGEIILAYFIENGQIFTTHSLLSKTNVHLRLGLAYIFNPEFTWILETVALILAIILTWLALTTKWHHWKVPMACFSFIYIILHGIKQGVTPSCHRLYIPMQCYFAILMEILLGIPTCETASLFTGYSLWSAGVAKLHHGWDDWTTGKAIKTFTKSKMPFPQAAGLGAIIFELVAPCMLFFGLKPRIFFVIAAVSFHIAISIFMSNPSYEPQMIAYSLILRNIPKKNTMKTKTFLNIVAFVLLGATFFHSDVWPISYIPMYSHVHHFGKSIESAKKGYMKVYHTQWVGFLPKYTKYVKLSGDCKKIKGHNFSIAKRFIAQGVGKALLQQNDPNHWLDAVALAKCKGPVIFKVCSKRRKKCEIVYTFGKYDGNEGDNDGIEDDHDDAFENDEDDAFENDENDVEIDDDIESDDESSND